MANSAKNKGDRYERDAVAHLIEAAPDLLCAQPQRMLGAGRKDDEGDLRVFDDVAVQVRAVSNMGTAVRSSAYDSVTQAGNGMKDFALGMVPIQGARKGKVRWLAAVHPDHWPTPVEPVADFAIISKALIWLGDDAGPYGYRTWPREERVCRLNGPADPVLIAPLEAWLHAYRQVRQQPQSA